MRLDELREKWERRRADGERLQSLAPIAAMAKELLEDLREVGLDEPEPIVTPAAALDGSQTWRALLWVVPPETRMTVADVAEAAGRPKSWVYRHTSPASGLPLIPHRKLDGELVFAAGEVRAWIRDHEDIVVKPTNVTPIHRARRRSVGS